MIDGLFIEAIFEWQGLVGLIVKICLLVNRFTFSHFLNHYPSSILTYSSPISHI